MATIVIVTGFFFQVSPGEWICLFLCIGVVLSAEAMNSAIEWLADTLHPEMDPGIRLAKDAAAGSVLVASLAAAIVGAIVFFPKLWELLSKS